MGIFPEEWMKQYETVAPRHASSIGMDISCGIAAGRPTARRTDKRERVLSLTWLLSGTGVLKVISGGVTTSQILEEGVLLLRRPDRQSVLTLDPCPCQRRCFIDMNPSLAQAMLMLMPELEGVGGITPRPFSQTLFDSFVEFIDMVDGMDAARPLSYIGPLCALISALYGFTEGTADEPIMRAARLLMIEPVSTTLPDIAGRCGIPYSTFRKRFLNVFGQTPGRWRIDQRIGRAKRELAAGEQIIRVAEHLSYSDVYTFTHQFHAVTGITPKKYQISNIL